MFYILFLYFQINYKLFLNKKMKKKRDSLILLQVDTYIVQSFHHITVAPMCFGHIPADGH